MFKQLNIHMVRKYLSYEHANFNASAYFIPIKPLELTDSTVSLFA